MKTIKKLNIAIVAAIAIVSCQSNAQQQNAEEMLKDSGRQNEIFGAICNDHEQMTQFMSYMMKNEHATQMMMGNHQVMKQMMRSEHMMDIMNENDEMVETMMGHMMQWAEQDSVRCGMMNDMMMGNEHMKDMCNPKGMKGMMKSKGHMMMHQHGNMMKHHLDDK